MKRQIQTSADVATCDAVMKLDTSREHAPELSLRNSGRSGGNTTVRLAVNMDGVDLNRVDT